MLPNVQSKSHWTIPNKLLNFIGGAFCKPIKNVYIESFNPATGKVLCQVPSSTEEDVDEAVKAAMKALPSWTLTSRKYRSGLLEKLASALEQRTQEFAEAESMDQGKTLRQALELEIPRCATNLRYYANLILNYHEMATDFEGANDFCALSVTRHEPIGVVGVISPWNLPLYLLTWKVAPALAMGNCVIAKPSELTSLTAYKFCELLKEVGFPDGVFNVIFGYGHLAGQAITEHPEIKAISFTGGTATGRKIAATAGLLGKKVSLELGGKNPGIIFDDCDLEATVEMCVKSSFSNQGEICLCTSRLYVQRSIYDQFLEKFTIKVKGIKVGDPLSAESDMGALVSAEHQKKVTSYIKMAKAESKIRVLLDGEIAKGDGFFVGPTVITDVLHESPLVQEEIFGPVVVVIPFDTEDEVIKLANSVQYGLAASVWTNDGQRGERIARQIKSGVVWVNCWMVRDLATPFGGVKASGYGREGGSYALEFFSDIKTITTALKQ